MFGSTLFVLRRPAVARRPGMIGIACFAALVAAATGLSAAPLEKEDCDRLRSEKQGLMVLGVDKEFAKGPDWAKANLGQAELNLLKRYLALDEQLKFRCGMATVTLRIPDEPEDGPDDDGVAGAPPVPPRKDQAGSAKPAPKPAAARQQPAATKAGAIPMPTMPLPAPVKPTPKPAPKAQSSWNTETKPADAAAPAAVEQIQIKPQPGGTRRLESGDGGEIR
jgi:hypothetical protein